MALRIQPLVISRSRIMTQVETAMPTTTRQLALRRSQITLMAVRTQPWVQGQDQTCSLASITLTSGNFVGTDADDEDSTIRIGDLSNGNGAGSLQCYIGGICNNPQPVGGSVVVVTLDLNDDHLGYDPAPAW